ncbi:hypothetical protein [Oceanobacillus profundus]|uniref:Uncharacterized protein n=1 Tax=Oceanobacillus profundus TaxID=372463 RepID=A0A417YGE4_9BACI|nr:hypothetical protein [Oceanobacillus profundus]MBR2246286.1 hypothetical protein [Bacilli bacterium]MBR3119695.1 hypothetical protein [Oceanobacillus sp.]RHW31855.1 hypothetical protein D1B32_11495 [Oceanobacillus profundus]
MPIRIAVASMSYLFLQHVANNPKVVNNQVVEGELNMFFTACIEENEPESRTAKILEESTISEIKEGGYLKDYTIDELTSEIRNSIYIILGRNSKILEDFFLSCLFKVN